MVSESVVPLPKLEDLSSPEETQLKTIWESTERALKALEALNVEHRPTSTLRGIVEHLNEAVAVANTVGPREAAGSFSLAGYYEARLGELVRSGCLRLGPGGLNIPQSWQTSPEHRPPAPGRTREDLIDQIRRSVQEVIDAYSLSTGGGRVTALQPLSDCFVAVSLLSERLVARNQLRQPGTFVLGTATRLPTNTSLSETSRSSD